MSIDLDGKFSAQGWRTPDTYISHDYGNIPEVAGVYILVATDFNEFSWPFRSRIAYIGQATKLLSRLKSHPIHRLLCRRHNHVTRWFKCFPIDQLRDIERYHIQLFDPPYNIIGRRRGWPSAEAT